MSTYDIKKISTDNIEYLRTQIGYNTNLLNNLDQKAMHKFLDNQLQRVGIEELTNVIGPMDLLLSWYYSWKSDWSVSGADAFLMSWQVFPAEEGRLVPWL